MLDRVGSDRYVENIKSQQKCSMQKQSVINPYLLAGTSLPSVSRLVRQATGDARLPARGDGVFHGPVVWGYCGDILR